MQFLANSRAFQINGLDVQSLKRAALDGVVGTVLTLLPLFVFGVHYSAFGFDLTPFMPVVGAWVVKLVRKWATDHSVNLPPSGPLGSSTRDPQSPAA